MAKLKQTWDLESIFREAVILPSSRLVLINQKRA